MALMSPTIILLLNVIFGAAILALPVQLVDSSPIPHPVSRSVFEPRTATIWRHGLGNHGETLARECARLRGFKLYEIKAAGNQGIDFVAMRRGQLGDIIDVKFVEVKTTYNPTYRLSRTTSGQQLSRSYIAERLKAMHSSGDDRVRQLAHDISAFRRQSKVPLDRLAEVNHVDFSSGKLRFISPLTGAEKAHINIPDLLRSVEQKSTTSEMRVWAKQHRLLWSLSSSTNMASWTKSSSVTLGLWKVSHTFGSTTASSLRRGTNAVARVLRTTSRTSQNLSKALLRRAGPIGLAVGVALDAEELYSTTLSYKIGNINRRQYVTNVSRIGGGMLGALGGAWAGAEIGMFAGSWGGPFIPLTVPAGGFIGAFAGGITGYLVGGEFGGFSADFWFQHLDDGVKRQVDDWFLSAKLKDSS